MNSKICAIVFLLISSMLLGSLTIPFFGTTYAQPPGGDMTFTSGQKINFASNATMTFRNPTQMTFQSNVTMKFGTNVAIHFNETLYDGVLAQCDWLEILWPLSGYLPPTCTWWEVIDPATGDLLGEFHVDEHSPPYWFHIDIVWTPTGGVIVYPGSWLLARMKVHSIEPCQYFEVHWPSHWWPEPCSWWEILDPETGKKTGYEFHVDWTNDSCEFHVDEVIPGPYYPPFPWYEIWARKKIPEINPCDYFVVEEPVDWWPEPCTWWEILDPEGVPTGLEFHVDWTNDSCEFHVDEVIPEPIKIPWLPPPVNLTVVQKIDDITACNWFEVVDPNGFLPTPCTWWEIVDESGAPTGLEFHIGDISSDMFHVDAVLPGSPISIPWGPSYTVTAVRKTDIISQCDWFKVDDVTSTPEPCSWWEIVDPVTGEPTGWEFHVDISNPDGTFHVDQVYSGWVDLPPTYQKTAEKKIDDISSCDWFLVIDPAGWVPEPCSWWEITSPTVWAGIKFHVDSNNGIDKFHIDIVDGGDPPPPPPPPPPWNVTAQPYEPPAPAWYMKPPYPDYAPSGMPDFDQRQWGTYNWTYMGGNWSHCGPTAVANSLWWLDSQFEPNTVPPPTIIDNYPLVQRYGMWDDHDPLNVPPLVEHLAYLMDTDGMRTHLLHSGTNVSDMQAGITHYLSWTGVNPLGDVDGDGIVTITDMSIATTAFGATPGNPLWDLRADIYPATISYPPVADNVIDNNDLALINTYMGMSGQFYEHTVMAPPFELIVEEVERCQDVVLLIAPWYYDPPDYWYRYDEGAHFVTVAGLNGSHSGTAQDPWEIVISDPILDNAEAGGYGNVPIPHGHTPPPEPPYVTHNNASLVSHDAYHVIVEPCPGGPLTITDYPRGPGPYPVWRWQIEAAVITSPYAVHDLAVVDVKPVYPLTGPGVKTIVFQGQSVDINVTVENQGSIAESFFDVWVEINATYVIGTQTITTLAAGNKVNAIFTWATDTSIAKGNYTLTGVVEIVPGETDTADNTYVYAKGIYISYVGDLTGGTANPWDFVPDGNVDGSDLIVVNRCFGSWPEAPPPLIWHPNCDITNDGIIDGSDVIIVARHYGEIDP